MIEIEDVISILMRQKLFTQMLNYIHGHKHLSVDVDVPRPQSNFFITHEMILEEIAKGMKEDD
jgi:hypothetical protein